MDRQTAKPESEGSHRMATPETERCNELGDCRAGRSYRAVRTVQSATCQGLVGSGGLWAYRIGDEWDCGSLSARSSDPLEGDGALLGLHADEQPGPSSFQARSEAREAEGSCLEQVATDAEWEACISSPRCSCGVCQAIRDNYRAEENETTLMDQGSDGDKRMFWMVIAIFALGFMALCVYVAGGF